MIKNFCTQMSTKTVIVFNKKFTNKTLHNIIGNNFVCKITQIQSIFYSIMFTF